MLSLNLDRKASGSHKKLHVPIVESYRLNITVLRIRKPTVWVAMEICIDLKEKADTLRKKYPLTTVRLNARKGSITMSL